jgi:hypothetical protein
MNAESWRHTDTPLPTITVLYRYNTVRNDFVDLKIMIKNTKTETATGSIYEHDEERESSFTERRQATHTALLTSSTATDPAMSLKHTLKKINSTGDVVEGIH